jgi:hypothetical protein
MIDGQVHKLLGNMQVLELGKTMHKNLKKLLHMVV